MVSLDLDNEKLAKTYDVVSDSQFKNGRRLIRKLGVKAGQAVLDVGCGTGRLSFYVAEKIKSSGRLIGIDPLATRIQVATAKNRLDRVSFKVRSSEQLEFVDSASLDVVYLNAVFHWIENKDATLAEIYRVLKPGGKLGITTAAKELNEIATLRSITNQVLGRAPYHFAPEENASTKHGVKTTELIEWLVKYQFRILNVEVREVRRPFKNPDHILAHSDASSFGNFLHHVPENLRLQARAEIREELARLQTKSGSVLTGHTIFAIAQKPRK